MDKDECFFLGKIIKKFSFKGELIIKIDSDYPEDYRDINSFFLEDKNILVPYIIEKSSLNREFLKVKLEGIDTEEQAEGLLKKNIYLPKECLPELDEDEFYYHEIIGFSVYDKEKGYIGQIKGINTSSAQDIFEIDYKGKEILIPVLDHLIDKVYKDKKEIYIDSPKGLVDFYLKL